MIKKSILRNLFKVEQMRLPLEGEPEADIIKPKKPKKVSLADPKIFRLNDFNELQDYLKGQNRGLNAEELLHIALDRDGTRLNSHRNLKELLGSDLIAPEAAKEALERLNNVRLKKEQGTTARVDIDDNIERILRYTKLPSEVYHEVLDSTQNKYSEERHGNKYDKIDKVLQNPHIDESHLLKAVEKHPEHASAALQHEKADSKRFMDRALGNEEVVKNLDPVDVQRVIEKSRIKDILTPNSAKNLLGHERAVAHYLKPEHIDHLLDNLDPIERKSFMDEKLGIKGGKPADDLVPFGDPPEGTDPNWNNWTNPDSYDHNLARTLSSSKHLTDDQAEHIKRHGHIDSKYNLYHNPHVDPKHGVEMFQKWHDNHEDHGYNADELKEKFEDHKADNIITPDEIPEEVIEEIENDDNGSIRDSAENSYSVWDYLNDQGITGWENVDPDVDEVHDILHEDYDDWTGDNPNSIQNVGRKDFDALDKLAQKYERDHAIDLDDFKEVTGLDHPSEIGLPELYDEKKEYIDMDDVHDKLDEFGGPSTIDYANHDEYSITEHPDYDDRFEKATQTWREKKGEESTHESAYEDHMDAHYESEPYQNALREATQYAKEEWLKENKSDLMSVAHQDDRFIPEHLHSHIPNFDEIKQNRMKRVGEGPDANWLNSFIPDRPVEHSYGENQHHYELAKDYADAKGGSIDIGTMHKLFPAQKETWKKMFGDKGKLSGEEIQSKIDEIPKTKYDISYGKWGSNKMQNLNGRDQLVVRLDHSPESIAEIAKDPELYDTFKHVQNVSQRSGHPTKDNTIAWARVDFSNKKQPFIDEVQSDFGKTVREYLQKEGHGHKAEHIKKIEDIHKNWRETLKNHILKLAKMHGAEKVFTHSPESKSKHTGADTVHSVYNDSYKKVPRSMGFKPVDAKEIPLTDRGLEAFKEKPEETPQTRAADHHEAAVFHTNIRAALPLRHPFKRHHSELAQKHQKEAVSLASGVGDTYGASHYSKKIKAEPEQEHIESASKSLAENKPLAHMADGLFGKPFEETKTLQGHVFDLQPAGLKKNIDLAMSLIKAELLYLRKYANKEDTSKYEMNIKYIQNLLGY